MPRKGRSNAEIVQALHQVESGEKVAEVCRRLGVSEQTFYRWKKQFTGLGLGAARAAIPAPRKRQVEAGRRRPDARSPHPAGDRGEKMYGPPRSASGTPALMDGPRQCIRPVGGACPLLAMMGRRRQNAARHKTVPA